MQHKGRMQAGFRKQASLSTNAETGYLRSSYWTWVLRHSWVQVWQGLKKGTQTSLGNQGQFPGGDAAGESWGRTCIHSQRRKVPQWASQSKNRSPGSDVCQHRWWCFAVRLNLWLTNKILTLWNKFMSLKTDCVGEEESQAADPEARRGFSQASGSFLQFQSLIW